MIILKRIQFLILSTLLLPICLSGMEQGSLPKHDKFGNQVTLEWQKITDWSSFFDSQEMLAPIYGNAFADELVDLRNFFCDEGSRIKKEHFEIFNNFSKGERQEIRVKIATSHMSRKYRVECAQKVFQRNLEKGKSHVSTTKKSFPNPIFNIIVRNQENSILGFAVFRCLEENVVSLDLLGVIPEAQGQGLSRLLVFSILNIFSILQLPEIKTIILGTEVWNTKAQAVYTKLGFTEVRNDGHYVSLRYEVTH